MFRDDQPTILAHVEQVKADQSKQQQRQEDAVQHVETQERRLADRHVPQQQHAQRLARPRHGSSHVRAHGHRQYAR